MRFVSTCHIVALAVRGFKPDESPLVKWAFWRSWVAWRLAIAWSNSGPTMGLLRLMPADNSAGV
jgi:hypothetical protein